MATVTKNYIRRAISHGAPYGNAWKKRFTLQTTATGAPVDADSSAALAIGDVVRIGWLPAGIELHDCLSIVSDGFTASTTIKLGFAYEDGVDSAAVPQDDDYFHAALSLAAAGRTRANNTAVVPVVLPKPAYLIATIQGAAQDGVGRLDVIVDGLNQGNP